MLYNYNNIKYFSDIVYVDNLIQVLGVEDAR